MTRTGWLWVGLAASMVLVSRKALATQASGVGVGTATQASGGGGWFDLGLVMYGVKNMAKGLRMSAAGLETLKRREGLRLSTYLDTAGKPTIGYGHLVGAFESFGSFISEQEATDLLRADLSSAENAVAALVTVPITQAQFDALVSFTFNVGVSAFRQSTLLQMLNAGQYNAAREQLGRWVYVTRGGVKVVDAGLQNRRGSEMTQFA